MDYTDLKPKKPSREPVQTAPSAQNWTQEADTNTQSDEDSSHSYLLAIAFSYFLGSFGLDRFYLGYTVTGILKLITFGGLGIWHLIDMILIVFGKKAKNSLQPLEGYTKYHGVIRMVAILLLIIHALALVGIAILIIVSVLGIGTLSKHVQDVRQQIDKQQQLQRSTNPTVYTN